MRAPPVPRVGAAADLAVFYAAWGALAAVFLTALPAPLGWRILLATLAYHVALPVFARWRRRPDWIALWVFLLPLGVMQILPDWYLVNRPGVLVFPDTGSPVVGTVPWFMAGLWVVALFPVLWLADAADSRRGAGAGVVTAALASSAMFTAAEATLWAVPIWHARDVPQTAHVAHYLLWPELALGLSAWAAWRLCREADWPLRLAAAATVMLVYQGNLTLSLALLG
jgi:hypothetical protein